MGVFSPFARVQAWKLAVRRESFQPVGVLLRPLLGGEELVLGLADRLGIDPRGKHPLEILAEARAGLIRKAILDDPHFRTSTAAADRPSWARVTLAQAGPVLARLADAAPDPDDRAAAIEILTWLSLGALDL